MRIVTQPKVYLMSRPSIAEGFHEFLHDMQLTWPSEPIGTCSAAAQLVELAGRICYMSFGAKAGSKSNQAYIDNLIGLLKESPEKVIDSLRSVVASGRKYPGSEVDKDLILDEVDVVIAQLEELLEAQNRPAHGSVLEHPTWTFVVVGAGRGFSHEQVRHRVGWAYSQLSTRYCDFERAEEEGTWNPGFVIPPLAQTSPEVAEHFTQRVESSLDAYKEVLTLVMGELAADPRFTEALSRYPERDRKRMLRKAARGAARDILPIATEAILTMTSNARAIWNTIALRASADAEGAIRDVYVQIARIMAREFPELFHHVAYTRLWDGSTAVTLPRTKL